jgi:hypothetical protein
MDKAHHDDMADPDMDPPAESAEIKHTTAPHELVTVARRRF